jgi:hypothetical protein
MRLLKDIREKPAISAIAAAERYVHNEMTDGQSKAVRKREDTEFLRTVQGSGVKVGFR